MSAWWLRPIFSANSLVQLKESLSMVVEKTGFRYFHYCGRFPRLRTGSHEILFDNCPDAWSAWYGERGSQQSADPLRWRAQREVTPIPWHEVSQRYPELFAMASQYGLATGVTHPVHGPDGQWSAISFIKIRGGIQAEHDIRLSLANGQLLSHYIHEAVARIIKRRLDTTLPEQRNALNSGLNERERECLILVATGKTASEIARFLLITERTVIYHLANARKKLGVVNSHHAVTKAISLGLIEAA